MASILILFISSPLETVTKSLLTTLQAFGGLQTPFPGGMTPGSATPSADLDLIKIGEARKSLVGVKLDQV